MIKVLPLVGLDALLAFQAFNSAMLGLKMLPAYIAEDYSEFYNRLSQLPLESQKKLIREASFFVNFEKSELLALFKFCADANGVPFTAENAKKLPVKDQLDMIEAVCAEFAQMAVPLVSETEKKKLKNFSIDLRETACKHPTMPFQEMVNLAFCQAVLSVQ